MPGFLEFKRNKMANEIMIPILPCRSINETLEFYVALGSEVTYQQTRPNSYACVRRDDIINKTLARPLCGRFALVI
jgi:hypothetical protein